MERAKKCVGAFGRKMSKHFKPVVRFFNNRTGSRKTRDREHGRVGIVGEQNNEPNQNEQQHYLSASSSSSSSSSSSTASNISNSQDEEEEQNDDETTNLPDRAMLLKDAYLAMVEVRLGEDYGEFGVANRAQRRLDRISEKLGIATYLMKVRCPYIGDEEEYDEEGEEERLLPAPPPPSRESTYSEDGPKLKRRRKH